MSHRVLPLPLGSGMSLVVYSKRDQGHDPGPFDLGGQFFLMECAGACDPPGENFTSLCDEILQHMRCLIIDGQSFFLTEPAGFSLVIRLLL